MKAFSCDNCGHLVFFENVLCVRCNHTLGFIVEALDLSALEPQDGVWKALAPHSEGATYKACINSLQYQVCNWLIPLSDPNALCRACRLNEIVPDLTVHGNHDRWMKLEIAKRRTLYTILRLRLPLDGDQAFKQPLRFRFAADSPTERVLTGHTEGLITINIAEADDDEREKRRVALHEPFRTLLGHLRHEIAHYYWDRLISGTPHIARFRELFGDESADYAERLQNHYLNGPGTDWETNCVSSYASAHPWEDWAETFAHYLHMLDTIETASSFGVSIRPKHPRSQEIKADLNKLSPTHSSFEKLYQNWLPLTYALNEINRGMGLPDLYPFVIPPTAQNKLRFIHELLQS